MKKKIGIVVAVLAFGVGFSAFAKPAQLALSYQGQTSAGVWTNIPNNNTSPCDETPSVVCIRELNNGTPDGTTFGVGFYQE